MQTENKSPSLKLDKNQHIAVNTFENVVVSAGAGSGKTRVLAERFMRLIDGKEDRAGTEVDRILTLTFTNKAAVEMKERIFKTLCDKSSENPRAREAVKNFDRAHIQTLDSYFSDIAKQGAHFYGITPAFKLDVVGINDMIKTRALEFILGKSRHSVALKKMLKLYQIDELAEKVFAAAILSFTSVVDSRDFCADLEKQGAEIRDVWAENAQIADRLVEKMCYAVEKENGGGSTIAAFQKFFSENPIKIGSDVIAESAHFVAMQEYGAFLSALFSCCEKKPSGKKGAAGEVADAFSALYEPYSSLVECIDFVENYETAKEIAVLLNEFQDEVNAAKRNSGCLTFHDVSRVAFHTLKEHHDIRHAEQKKYDKIMIDEFQDNNQMQCEVLFMLADKNERFDENGYIIPNFDKNSADYIQKRLENEKLFFVGDEKQRIYRFRDADVSVFRNLQEHLGKCLQLDTNYRSKPALISSFNVFFGGMGNVSGVFPISADAENIQKYEAVYETVKIPNTKKSDFLQKGKRIEIALYKEEKKETETDVLKKRVNKRNCQAAFIAKKIHELIAEGYRYSDIALLFRTATQLKSYEKELLHEKIPYSTEVFNGFYSDGPVNDLVSYLKICAYPDDINALVKVFRSSFVNLDLEKARALASKIREALYSKKSENNAENDTEEEFFAPFDKKAQEIAMEVLGKDSVEYERFSFAQNEFAKVKKALKTSSILSVISMLWNDLGYRYETLWNSDVSMYSAMYDILLELARGSEKNASTLAAFIDYVETFKDDSEKIDNLNIPMESSDSVKILTIHKSKGLEFKVVFICDISAKPKSQSISPVMLCNDVGAAISMPAGDFFETCKTKKGMAIFEKRNVNYFWRKKLQLSEWEDEAELKRVAYVAFTRAEERLIVVGNEQKKANSIVKKTIFDVIAPFLEFGNSENAFFTLNYFDNTILQENAENVKKSQGTERKNTDSEKIAFAAEKLLVYQNAQTDAKEEIAPVHISPSSLEIKDEKDEQGAVPCSEIDVIVKKSIPKREFKKSAKSKGKNENVQPRFGYNDFGTIAHKTLENRFSANFSEIPLKLYDGIDDEKDIDAINTICSNMADSFEKSELFAECKKASAAGNAEMYSEYAFRSALDFVDLSGKKQTVIVSGSMDLVFKNASTSPYKYTIVDYKTDRFMHKERYIPQLSCYRAAAADIFGCDATEIRCVLYFLRYNADVDISKECSLESATAELQRILSAGGKNDS